MDTHFYDIQIRVLICPEEGEFVARALEMDLLAYGTTERGAVEELKRAVEAQISFAHQQKDPSLIYFPAEKEYFERWEAANSKALRSQVSGDKSAKIEGRAVIISFTKSELKGLRDRRFKHADLACA